MQTFLPFPSFKDSAKVLDYKRLGKQRVEALQILKILQGEKSRWSHHPAVKMWKGSEMFLAFYGQIICEEWRRRGYEDNLWIKFQEIIRDNLIDLGKLPPEWFGDERLHRSHRANLFNKDPIYYAAFEEDAERWEVCCASCKYWWPTHIGRE